MKNCVVSAINGDVHIDGVSMTRCEAVALAYRIVVAAEAAEAQVQHVRCMVARAGERMARAELANDQHFCDHARDD